MDSCTEYFRLLHLLHDTRSTPTTRTPNLWRACPISLGRGGRTVTGSTRGLNAGVGCCVHDELTVLLEWLSREYLGE